MKSQTEAEITRAIRQLLKTFGIFHYKQWQGLGSLPGVADIIGIYKGRYLAVEVKRPGGRVSDKQRLFLQNVTAAGGIAIVAFSLDDVINGLNLKDKMLV